MKSMLIGKLSQVTESRREGHGAELQEGKRRAADGRIITSVLEGYALYGAALYPPLMHAIGDSSMGIDFSRYQVRRSYAVGDAANEIGVNDNLRALPPLICESSLQTTVDDVPLGSKSGDALNGWMRAAAARLKAVWRYMRHEREIARSISMLARLDDRTLSDIGLHRSQIPHVARYGLGEDGRIQSHPS